jgi:hypothetical protein
MAALPTEKVVLITLIIIRAEVLERIRVEYLNVARGLRRLKYRRPGHIHWFHSMLMRACPISLADEQILECRRCPFSIHSLKPQPADQPRVRRECNRRLALRP